MTVIAFPLANRRSHLPDPTRKAGGHVYVEPSETRGGSWAVEHVSESGDSAAIVRDGIFDLASATALARESAADHNARFHGFGDGDGDAA